MDHEKPQNTKDAFRDSINTISKEGKRNWIFAKKPKGTFYNARSIVSVFYLILFFSLPFFKVHDSPIFLFNVLERKFIFFGSTFWPQDFFIFGIGMLTFILFVVLFTVVFGRVFCGWACPQTIFMEMVFRKIEYWIDGDAAQQRILAQMPYNFEKIRKRILKHVSFFLMAFVIANTFLAYIIGSDELFKIISEPISEHRGGLASLLIFTSIFFAVYSWFREQVCLIVCPYGRLQGVMTDRNSLLVAYDYLRGEPRDRYNKLENRKSGDCIDCNQCVKVCPVGIDIRNGTQLECTNCTACMDACNYIMKNIDLPQGLIRYASENGIAKKEKLRFTSRMLAYSVVLFLLLSFLVVLLSTRSDLDATILRTPGLLYQKQPNNIISNLYNIKLINKTHKDMPITIRLESEFGYIIMVGKNVTVPKESKAENEFFIYVPRNQLVDRKTKFRIAIYSGDKKIQTIKTNFLGPITSN